MAGSSRRPATLRGDQSRRRLSRAHRTAKILRLGNRRSVSPCVCPENQPQCRSRRPPARRAGKFIPASSTRQVRRTIGARTAPCLDDLTSPRRGHRDAGSAGRGQLQPSASKKDRKSRDHLPHRRARGFARRARSRRPARVARSSAASGWRTRSLRMTPPSIMTVLVARRPHWRFS
jgi:hypothetical protein